MPAPTVKTKDDGIRIGNQAAMQPLSGVRTVNETYAVHGIGRGGFVRKEDAQKSSKRV